jgi:hypothetical protein
LTVVTTSYKVVTTRARGTEMATYVYREGCGWEGEFEADSDAAAEDRVLKTFRSDGNPDFDGDSAELFRLDWDDEDGEFFRVGVSSFAGENMIEDVYSQRNR